MTWIILSKIIMKNLNKVIISGGSKGIGFDLVKHYLSYGFKVLCISRRKPQIIDNNLSFLKIDLSKKKELIKNKKKIEGFNCKYLICNAADLGEINYFNSTNIQKWQKSFFLNLFSHVYITKYCLNSIKKKRGAVFFLAGGGAANSFKKFSAYSLAKTALVRFAENIAAESKNNYFSYAVTPGPVKTDLMKKTLKHGHKIEKNRIVKSNKLIELINYLMKSKKNFLNGKYIHVNDNYRKFTKKNSKDLFFLRRVENRNIK